MSILTVKIFLYANLNKEKSYAESERKSTIGIKITSSCYSFKITSDFDSVLGHVNLT